MIPEIPGMRLKVKSLVVSGALLMSIYACLAAFMLWLFAWPWNAAFAAVVMGTAAAAVVLRARDVLNCPNDTKGSASREAKAS